MLTALVKWPYPLAIVFSGAGKCKKDGDQEIARPTPPSARNAVPSVADESRLVTKAATAGLIRCREAFVNCELGLTLPKEAIAICPEGSAINPPQAQWQSLRLQL